MKSLHGKGRTAIGLAIGPRRIGAVQLHRARRGAPPRLAAASGMTRPKPGAPPTADELSRVFEALDRQGFEGQRVVLVTPQDKLMSGVLDVPPRASGAPLDQIVRNELARTNRVENGQLECGWWELPPGVRETEGTQVIAVGCKHEDAMELLEACDGAEMEVVALDAPGPALARAVCGKITQASAMTGIMEIGSESALLVVMRGQTIVYERALAEGGLNTITAQLVKKLAVDEQTAEYLLREVGVNGSPSDLEDEAELLGEARAIVCERADELASEARASAAYAGRRYAENMTRLLLTGEGAALPGLAERLAKRVEADTTTICPLDLFESGGCDWAADAFSSPALTLAAGLALHEESAR